MQSLYPLYHPDLPNFILSFLQAPEMQRLQNVGMNCGCEYTQFPLFRNLAPYSRYEHSLGCALIVWHFTDSQAESLAALFHDIATPVFAHTIDFMHGDHLTQESTETDTSRILKDSEVISEFLESYALHLSDVDNYHLYPIADNDSPRLSADRLEYTMGNLVNFGFCSSEVLRTLYDDLCVTIAEDEQPELAFRTLNCAELFGHLMLKCSAVYVSDPDRYAMQALSEVIRFALDTKTVSPEDLLGTEPQIIRKLESHPAVSERWTAFRSLHETARTPFSDVEEGKIIPAKKRYIDPLIVDQGRLSALCPSFREEIDAFLSASQEEPVYAH